jgi:pimeloyl-ACP methyl ester carboxylesterase
MKRGAVKNRTANRTDITSKILLLNDKTYVEQFRAHQHPFFVFCFAHCRLSFGRWMVYAVCGKTGGKMANKKISVALAAALGVSLLIVQALYNATPRDTSGEQRTVLRDGVPLVYSKLSAAGAGRGTDVVMVPSLGRSASDFNELAEAMQARGHDVVLVEPRGMRTRGGLGQEAIDLFDLADDVAAIVADANLNAHVIIGHAFGNRVSRAYATKHADSVLGTVLIAAGGKVAIEAKTREALLRSFWVWMPDAWRRPYIRHAFFAGDNALPDYWVRGWNIPTSRMQIRATGNTPSKTWWHGGSAPLLVIQAMQDTIAPPEHTADLLEQEFGARVRVARIENSGHAILPEHPERVEAAIASFMEEVGRR